METIGNTWLYLAFFGLVTIMLIIDFLGFRQTQGQDVKIKTAAYWSIAWVSVAALFGGGLWLYLQQTAGVTIANAKVIEYFAGYLLEKSLAVDNVFVWLMIFAAFAIPPALQRQLLLYGVCARLFYVPSSFLWRMVCTRILLGAVYLWCVLVIRLQVLKRSG